MGITCSHDPVIGKRFNLGKVHLLCRGGDDEDVLKKAHIFTGPLLRLLVNFRRPPPPMFLKF